jgi:hypothetical protein
MPWPPQKGELLPRFDEPIGIEEKLAGYSLNLDPDKPRAWGKANGFLKMLGIGLDSIYYLECQIRRGIATTPMAAVEPGRPGALICTVQFRIAGTGRYIDRTASLRTHWELTGPLERPRMTNAFLRGKEHR